MFPVLRRFPRSALALLLLTFGCAICAMPAGPAFAGAADEGPLTPIDTSSPRTTLGGFLDFINHGFAVREHMLRSYLESPRLYLTPEEVATMHWARERLDAVQRTLDLSKMPPATARDAARGLTLQLKEVLDRLELPPTEAIPDAEAMAKAEFKRWTLPNSDIRIARVESGPRAGEYLFAPDTVERMPEFYHKVEHLPYRAGASPGLYGFYAYSPIGVALALQDIVPPRWLLGPPGGNDPVFLDQPPWRWFGIVTVLALGVAVGYAGFRLALRWHDQATFAGRWARLLRPLSLIAVVPTSGLVLTDILRVSGGVSEVLTLSFTTLFFLSLTWMAWGAGGALAEAVIYHEKLRASSIDSQLVRLVLRLVTLIVAIAILVVGADRVGLPSYSVVAGLGVGGLAVALAAQQTLANLLGSLIIMFEKPFAIGHWIKVNDLEGVVEDVGFRSTRIRTFYNSLVSIPSSELVNTTVDNMELREYRRIRTTLSLTYDTPPGKIEEFVAGVRAIVQAHPHTRKDLMHVYFNEFSASSLDVMLYFFVRVPNWGEELRHRERIFLDILNLAEELGVSFAFPTETVRIESFPAAGAAGKGFAEAIDAA